MLKAILRSEFTGGTLDEAVEKGLSEYQCTRAEVDIDIVQAPSKKLFGLLGTRPAVVRLRLMDRAFIARHVTERLLQMSGFCGQVHVHPASDVIEIEMVSDQSSRIIGRHGQALDALNYLVSSMVDRVVADRTRIVLNIDGYREKRQVSLQRLARRICSQVRRSGKQGAVNPLPAEEQKTFLNLIIDEPGVEGKAVGQGKDRKIIIYPRKT